METENLIALLEPENKLGIITAAIFLAGEMAGSGVLALPAALKGTGWSGLFLIIFFSINAAYIGSRLVQNYLGPNPYITLLYILRSTRLTLYSAGFHDF